MKEKVITYYYKAIYTNGDTEVFVGSDVASAEHYASGENARGRTLEPIKEYRELLEALTDYQ